MEVRLEKGMGSSSWFFKYKDADFSSRCNINVSDCLLKSKIWIHIKTNRIPTHVSCIAILLSDMFLQTSLTAKAVPQV